MSDRSQRCTDHGVRGCYVCFPVKKQDSPASLPEVPIFPSSEDLVEKPIQVVEKTVLSVQIVEKPVEPSSPIVSAAMRYTEVCNLHAKAQATVARLKQELEEANKYEVSIHLDRKIAQEEMAKLIAEAT